MSLRNGDEMFSPEQRRELLRLANRDRLDREQVADLIQYAELIYSMPEGLRNGQPYPEPPELYTIWKESFDEPT